MQNQVLRKWVLIAVAFVAASSLVLVAASRLGQNAKADSAAGNALPAVSDTGANQGGSPQVIDNQVTGHTALERDANSGSNRESPANDDDDDDEHEAAEHQGRSDTR